MERRAAASKLILNAEVGHLVYFFINLAEREGHARGKDAFLIKGRIFLPSSTSLLTFSLSYSRSVHREDRSSLALQRSRRKRGDEDAFYLWLAMDAESGSSYSFED